MLGTATKLQNTRQINGTNFDGTGNITTSKWGTSRNLALSGAVSGNANIDGSGNVTINTTQANVAVLTGNLTATKSANPGESFKQTQKTINYPSGYTKDNSVCIMFATSTDVSSRGYSCEGSENVAAVSAGLYSGNIPRRINLGSSNITIALYNTSSSDLTIYYKIVLMKI